MATKELSIIVKAVDAFTAPFRSITSSISGGIKSVVTGLGSAFTGLINRITSVKTLIAGAFVGFVGSRLAGSFNDAARALDEVGNASQRLGLSVETLSVLKYAADLNGSSFQEMAEAVRTAQRRLGELSVTGGGRAAEYFKRLGVQLFDNENRLRDFNDLLPELASAIKALPPAQRIAYAERIFGNASVLNLGLENLKAVREEATRLGAVFSPEQTKASQDYKDALDRLGGAWLGLRAKIVAAVGPMLANVLNQFASFVAAVPRIVANLGDVVANAIGGNREAQAKIEEVFTTFGKVVEVGLAHIGDIAFTAVQFTVRLLSRFLDTEIAQWFGRFGANAEKYIGISFQRMQIEWTKGLGKLTWADPEAIAKQVEGYKEQISELERDILAANRDMQKDMTRNPVSLAFETAIPGVSLDRDIADLKEAVGAAGSKFADAVDNILSFREALRETAFDASRTNTAIKDLQGNIDKPAEPPTFIEGVKQAFRDLKQQTDDLFNTGLQMTSSLVQSISGGLSSAIVAVVSGTQSLGEAFKAFGRQALQTISQVILQVLVLRAVSGLVGGFLGGGSGQMAGGVPQPGVVSGSEFSLGGVQGIARDGGVIVAGGVRRFMAGGTVQGPNLNLDMVHALLAPGERVFSRDEVRRVGARRLDALGAGADPAEVFGGGGGITINQTINVAGGGGGGGGADARMLEGIRKATYDGLLAALSARPALRQGLRAALA